MSYLKKIKSDFEKELKMNTYILKTVDGGKFKIKAKGLIELIKEINLIFIDELQYEIEDFISLTDKNFNEVELTENEETWDSLAEQGHSPQMIESILADRESDNE